MAKVTDNSDKHSYEFNPTVRQRPAGCPYISVMLYWYYQMQRGSLIMGMIGTIFTLIGVCINQWLEYDPEKSGKNYGDPVTVGLWNFVGEVDGEEFELGWTDKPEGAQQTALTQWWFNDTWVNATR